MSTNQDHEIYNYTSGRWLYNERLRLDERRLFINVSELCRVSAIAVDRDVKDIDTFRKVAEGGSYRIIEVTFRDRFQVIARLPYPSTKPVTLGISSEVATMDFLRRHGLPIPKVYDWSSSTSNFVGAEYMIMEKAQGTELQSIWYSMEVEQRMDIVGKIVELEKILFEVPLPASGSIYFKDTLDAKMETVEIVSEIAPNRFCVGPSTEYLWWYQKRDELAIKSGPWANSAEILKQVGRREIAWLQQFGEPRLPRETFYREFYNYQKMDPKVQLNSLSDYLSIISCLVPDEEKLNRHVIRHPDLSPQNIFISESGDITGIIDWQHCVVLPLFLQAKMPHHFQNYGDEYSENFQPPKLPANFETMTDDEKEKERELYRRRQLHFFYLGFTSHNNPIHFDAISSSSLILRNKLYESAGRPWDGDNTSLKANLIRCAAQWADVSSKSSPDCVECPLNYPHAEAEQCLELDTRQSAADASSQRLRDLVGVNIDGWVPLEGYEEALEKAATIKAQMLASAETREERREVEENWPFLDHVDQF